MKGACGGGDTSTTHAACGGKQTRGGVRWRGVGNHSWGAAGGTSGHRHAVGVCDSEGMGGENGWKEGVEGKVVGHG